MVYVILVGEYFGEWLNDHEEPMLVFIPYSLYISSCNSMKLQSLALFSILTQSGYHIPVNFFPTDKEGIYPTTALTRDCYRLGRPIDLPRRRPGAINCGDEYRVRVLQEVFTAPQMWHIRGPCGSSLEGGQRTSHTRVSAFTLCTGHR